jgi:hypothetical protein
MAWGHIGDDLHVEDERIIDVQDLGSRSLDGDGCGHDFPFVVARADPDQPGHETIAGTRLSDQEPVAGSPPMWGFVGPSP